MKSQAKASSSGRLLLEAHKSGDPPKTLWSHRADSPHPFPCPGGNPQRPKLKPSPPVQGETLPSSYLQSSLLTFTGGREGASPNFSLVTALPQPEGDQTPALNITKQTPEGKVGVVLPHALFAFVTANTHTHTNGEFSSQNLTSLLLLKNRVLWNVRPTCPHAITDPELTKWLFIGPVFSALPQSPLFPIAAIGPLHKLMLPNCENQNLAFLDLDLRTLDVLSDLPKNKTKHNVSNSLSYHIGTKITSLMVKHRRR